jgi:hypothetical protein
MLEGVTGTYRYLRENFHIDGTFIFMGLINGPLAHFAARRAVIFMDRMTRPGSVHRSIKPMLSNVRLTSLQRTRYLSRVY